MSEYGRTWVLRWRYRDSSTKARRSAPILRQARWDIPRERAFDGHARNDNSPDSALAPQREGSGSPGPVKGRKRDRILFLNHVSPAIVEARRGKYTTHVFPYRGHRIHTISNIALQSERRAAGKEDPYLADLRVHDLRRTVGMRLRDGRTRQHRSEHPLARAPSLQGTTR